MAQTLIAGGMVLGVTPSLAAFGWALVRLEPDGETVEGLGVLRTRTRYGTGEAAADAAAITRRVRSVALLVRTIAQREPLVAIVRRGLSARATVDDGRVTGLVDALGVELEVPIVDLEPRDLDGAVGDEQHAEAAREGWDELLDDDEIPVSIRRHALEAVAGVRLAAARFPVVAEARQIVRVV